MNISLAARRPLLLVLLIAAMVGGAFIPSSPLTAAGTWTTKASMLQVRTNGSIGVIDGVIYAAGEYYETNNLGAYDPLTNAWVDKGPAAPVTSNAYGVIGGRFYQIGGHHGAVLTTSVTSYDPETNTWSTHGTMPIPRNHPAGGVIGDKLYIAGGDHPTLLQSYEPATNTWATLAPMPIPNGGAAAGAVAGGKFYVIGGVNDSGVLSTVQIYDPSTDQWTTGAPMPTARATLTAAELGGTIYVFGGSTATGGILATVESYNTVTDTWSTEPNLPTARAGARAAAVGGAIYVMGGTNFYENFSTNEAFTPEAAVVDSDGDGILDTTDNCPVLANPDQTDTDGDGVGDACDPDDDNDSIVDSSDSCPLTAEDLDGYQDTDGCPEADTDTDGDGVPDSTDNCPTVPNPDQTDTDWDGIGDACDAPSVLEVTIDVKPDRINTRRNNGVVWVAVLTASSFDAATVDPGTVCFGDAEDPSQRDCSEAHDHGHIEDADGDGDLDMVLHFDTQQTGIDAGDNEACLTGTTYSGQAVSGCDAIVTISGRS